MNYGYTVGAAGVIAAMHRQDVAANNLANIETVGFKPDFSTTIPREAARVEDGLYNIPSNTLLERLGAGVLLAPTRTEFAQGTLAQSRNPFDVAIQGNGFLTVADGSATRYTRDGRMTLRPDGRLVTVTDGRAVLDDAGRPITLDPSQDVVISTDGEISQNGTGVAKLGFVDVADRAALRKIGDNLFAFAQNAATTTSPASGRVMQYAIERSGSDPIRAVLAVQNTSTTVQTTVKLMQIHDELMNRVINTLGRVA